MNGQPSFASTVSALRTTHPRHPWVKPTDDETEVADLLAELEQLHQPAEDNPDTAGHYGTCAGCAALWPCDAWNYGEQLAIQYLGRAADRVYAHAQAALEATSSAA